MESERVKPRLRRVFCTIELLAGLVLISAFVAVVCMLHITGLVVGANGELIAAGCALLASFLTKHSLICFCVEIGILSHAEARMFPPTHGPYLGDDDWPDSWLEDENETKESA